MKYLKSFIGYSILFALFALAYLILKSIFECYTMEFVCTFFGTTLLMIAYYEIDKKQQKRIKNERQINKENC